MNEYEVTYVNGEVVEIEAWTPELAEAVAEEEADLNGRPLSVASVRLLASQVLNHSVVAPASSMLNLVRATLSALRLLRRLEIPLRWRLSDLVGGE